MYAFGYTWLKMYHCVSKILVSNVAMFHMYDASQNGNNIHTY